MDTPEKDRIKQYISQASDQDEDFIASSFLKKGNEEALKDMAREHWENSSSAFIDLRHVLDRVHLKINAGRSKPLISGQKLFRLYTRAAAVLLIPLVMTVIWLLRPEPVTYSEITAPQGSRVQFTLPDGSKGFLNSGSVLQYRSQFTHNRQIQLTGEGYFEVTKDKKHPFTVQTKLADVQVLGTRFDVCAYPADPEMTTTLEEGSIRIFNKTTNTRTALAPGEQNKIDSATGEMTNTKVKTQLYTSWKEEMLRFDNAPFAEVVKKMERWYGVKIILDKKLQYADNYTLTIKTESLREMLQLLSITTPMNYKIKDDTVFINQPKKKELMKN